MWLPYVIFAACDLSFVTSFVTTRDDNVLFLSSNNRKGPRLPPRQEARYLESFEELMGRWEDSDVEFFVPQLAAVLLTKGVPSRNVHVSQAREQGGGDTGRWIRDTRTSSGSRTQRTCVVTQKSCDKVTNHASR